MLDSIDLVIFLSSVALTMGFGFMVSKGESDSEDYFMAGRSIPWWGVAGSVFGTNVSANHLVGMLGIGFSIGFAQSHYELGAILAILLMAYFFLPVYSKLKITTLSEYLTLRFGEVLGLMYSITLLILIFIQLTAAFYIGSRTLGILLEGSILEVSYGIGIVVLMMITAGYTMVGGLRAVVVTDVIQSVLLLASGLLISVLVFSQPEVGGFFELLAKDRSQVSGEQKMRLFLPSDHPDLPWTGVFSGLMVLHIFFWSNNQYLVQRVLAARSEREAKIGLLTGAFLKLLVPFFSVSSGVAAAYFFRAKFPDMDVAPDDAFPMLVNMIVPAGIGLVGIITAGLLGAIISSLDSMLNSASTLFTIDIYNKYIKKDNSGSGSSVLVGRLFLGFIVLLSGLLAYTTHDPNSKQNFFLTVSRQSSYFTPGIVAAFLAGIFYKSATKKGALICVISTLPFSLGVDWLYSNVLVNFSLIEAALGSDLNFLHRSMIVFLLCYAMLILFSEKEAKPNAAHMWQSTGNEKVFITIATIVAVLEILFILLSFHQFIPRQVAVVLAFSTPVLLGSYYLGTQSLSGKEKFRDDRFIACLILGLTMSIFAYFV